MQQDLEDQAEERDVCLAGESLFISGLADSMVEMGILGFSHTDVSRHVHKDSATRETEKEADKDRDHDGSHEECDGEGMHLLKEATPVDQCLESDGTSRIVHRRVCYSVCRRDLADSWWRRGMALSCLES